MRTVLSFDPVKAQPLAVVGEVILIVVDHVLFIKAVIARVILVRELLNVHERDFLLVKDGGGLVRVNGFFKHPVSSFVNSV